jgi:hypothetical protein
MGRQALFDFKANFVINLGGPKGCLFKQSDSSGQLALQSIQQLTIFLGSLFLHKRSKLEE